VGNPFIGPPLRLAGFASETPPRRRFAPSGRSSGVPEFRSSGSRDLDVERSGTPPHDAVVGRWTASAASRTEGTNSDGLRACVLACLLACVLACLRALREASNPLIGPPLRLAGFASEPPPRPRCARSRRSSGIPEFRSSGVPDRAISTWSAPELLPTAEPWGGVAERSEQDGGDQLRRVAPSDIWSRPADTCSADATILAWLNFAPSRQTGSIVAPRRGNFVAG